MPPARLVVVLLAATAALAGCGGGSSKAAKPGTLNAYLARPGPEVALVQGTSDYAVGPVRVSFLVLDAHARSIERPRAQIWVARGTATTSLTAEPILTAEATLETIGVPGRSASAFGNVARIYVAHFRLAKPGTYTLVAQPEGAKIQGITNLEVAVHPQAPAVGDKAIASDTPTLLSTHGNIAALTTAKPPDRSLLRYSVAGSLTAHVPFVLVFATPKFCTSRVCGPTVDVVQAVQRTFASRGIRFIHVEIYRGNNPTHGFNQWVKQWHLPTEPWIFLVGRNGRIEARFEGAVSLEELEAAVRRL